MAQFNIGDLVWYVTGLSLVQGTVLKRKKDRNGNPSYGIEVQVNAAQIFTLRNISERNLFPYEELQEALYKFAEYHQDDDEPIVTPVVKLSVV